MKALQLEKPQAWRRIDIAEPAAPAAGEVLLRVHRIGICGTDISGYLGKMPFFSYPRIPGHELGVEVLAVGPGVTNVAPGDRCSVEPYLNCGHCYTCRRGHTNCCETNKTLGVMCDGGMTERIILPARKMHPSKKLSFDQLALVAAAVTVPVIASGEYPAKFTDGNTAVVQVAPWGITYHTERLKGADIPKDWPDVLKPHLKGQILLPDPRSSDSYLDFWALLFDKYGESFFTQLRAQAKAGHRVKR